MKTRLARSTMATVTATAVGISFVAPLARAAEAAPAPVARTLAAAVDASLAQRDLSKALSLNQEPALTQGQANPDQPSQERGFFSGPRGVFAIGLMVIGTAWVVKSTFSDRIDNPARQ